MKILIIEDDNSLRELMQQALADDSHIIETAANATTAMMKADLYDYDCILLDIMLPDGNGLDVLRHLKDARKEAGVIIISAKDSLEDKVTGLDLGADDYLTKPFHIAELSARVKSVFRRKQQHGESFVEFGNVKISPETRQVLVNGQSIELLKKEFDILHFFRKTVITNLLPLSPTFACSSVRSNLHSILSDQISHSVVSDSLRPHESQHTRPPCPSPTPGVHRDSHPSSQ